MTDGTGTASGPTVQDLLDHSPIAPLLNMPVPDVLAHLGLPPLPQMPSLPPLPHMPPLPQIDLTALIKPLTDLLAGFGSGSMADAPFDPTQLFDGIFQTLQSMMSLGTQAISALEPFWSGPAFGNTMAKGLEAHQNGGQTGGQSADISVQVQAAMAVVAKGVALLEGVIGKFLSIAGAILPMIVTPPGQFAMMTLATDSIAEGTAVVAATRAELAVHTGSMMATAEPVLVTAVPQLAGEIPGMASTVVQTASAPIESFISNVHSGGGISRAGIDATGDFHGLDHFGGGAGSELSEAQALEAAGGADGFGGGEFGALGAAMTGAGGLLGTGGTSAASASTPLTPRATPDSLSPNSSRAAAARMAAAEEEQMMRRPVASPGGVMPGGAGLAAAANANNDSESRNHLATARNASEIVGDLPNASPTVLGAAETEAAAPGDRG
ncbi:hypothetical protein GCM10027169_07220 [Gordonia jinhuaensis]|uniref:Uncharacterized protein n=1 Tax=Gordonia jinhuaensis TaxID=1517702 RepID=A0A916WQW3_9ACTN|nr:hypothetical protein [Gordonia jinhuaensis]GGB21302.1 hypothetical protein GCM10011489_06820 [Gordonia jinhuaensis]